MRLVRPRRVSDTPETLGVCSGCKHHRMCELEAVCQSCQQVIRRRKQNHVEKMSHSIQINELELCREGVSAHVSFLFLINALE